jgi:hypothetical protein
LTASGPIKVDHGRNAAHVVAPAIAAITLRAAAAVLSGCSESV